MKTLLVVTKENLRKHAGREVDDYVEVALIPTPESMPQIANEIRNRIRALIVESDREAAASGKKPEREISIEFDASPPYRVILASLADIMAQEEKLMVHLPEDFRMKSREEGQA